MLLSDVCLFDVCLSRTPGLSREQRGLGRPKLAQRLPTSHVTRTPLSRSKGQGHQAALLIAALTRQAAAAVSVGTYWAWETTAMLRCARRREALRRPQREERGGGISWRPPAYSLFLQWPLCHLSVEICANRSISFYRATLCMHSAAVAVVACPSVRHMPVFDRNG